MGDVINFNDKVVIKAERTAEEIEIDKTDGLMSGQAKAFQIGRGMEEAVVASNNSSDWKAAYIVGFLQYFSTVYDRLEEQTQAAQVSPANLN